jgi:hypothetical protein
MANVQMGKACQVRPLRQSEFSVHNSIKHKSGLDVISLKHNFFMRAGMNTRIPHKSYTWPKFQAMLVSGKSVT